MHQISLICVFLVGIWRQYYNISFQHSWIHQIAKFREKRNVRNFRTENALFGYFWAIIFENHWYIWNQHFRNGGIAKFCEETKMFKFRTRNVLLSIFDQECLIWVFLCKNFLKNYCHNRNQHPQFCVFAKFHEKSKLHKFETKNAWFGYFWAGIS